ncbi:MAG: DNA helicase, partial [Treponema sp.]|nr:DNA helicase [Treponema sp.]
YLSSIQSSQIVDGTYIPINTALVDDLKLNPEKYQFLFDSTANLKVLNYLSDCNKLEGVPSLNTEFHLIERFDDDTAQKNLPYKLSPQQFTQLVDAFHKENFSKQKNGQRGIKQLCLNKLSLHTPKGLYVLAYREVLFDVAEGTLQPSGAISFNREFAFSAEAKGKVEKESISRFLDADDLFLLNDFENNLSEIERIIETRLLHKQSIDEMPYFLCLQRHCTVDLGKEYESILRMYAENTVTVPIKAFFGELRSAEPLPNPLPIALLNNKVNLDQLLSIYNAMNYPVSYIQGPPGTGKTNTIINTIVTAFFNEKTVLFASYNNHPIDTVFDTLHTLTYTRGNGQTVTIPFPILRLGNNKKVAEAIAYIKRLYEQVKDETIYKGTLSRNKDAKIESTKKLTALLNRHQERVDLAERKDTLEALIEKTQNMDFRLTLEGQQLSLIKKRLEEIGEITDGDALALLQDDEDFTKYMYFTSARYIQKLSAPEYEELRTILALSADEKQVSAFNKYTSNAENLHKLQAVFPLIATTCSSAHKLGDAKPQFDMTIIDEASQCNTAVSLVPIIRGRSLMLVGDPQQLNPVITLDAGINQALKEKYTISDDYDYITHSIYKAFLANDAVSEEILLHNHYRCAKEIIEFSNKKYYADRLNVMRECRVKNPLAFCNVEDSGDSIKNSSQAEAKKVVSYIKEHPDTRIGIITPFRNQKELIEEELKNAGLDIKKYPCGTVHAFQGDEKDNIIFSLALTGNTHEKTYDWLRNNRELINVATSRAKDKLLIVADSGSIERLHQQTKDNKGDDLYELANYVKQNGQYTISHRQNTSRALGTKPYQTETEQVFLTTLNHAISNIITNGRKFIVHTEAQISHVFNGNASKSDFFYRGSFDFVIYRVGYRGKEEPVLAIELNGREHYEDARVKKRDEEKCRICREHGFELIHVQNSYARRYNFIKEILTDYFQKQ